MTRTALFPDAAPRPPNPDACALPSKTLGDSAVTLCLTVRLSPAPREPTSMRTVSPPSTVVNPDGSFS